MIFRAIDGENFDIQGSISHSKVHFCKSLKTGLEYVAKFYEKEPKQELEILTKLSGKKGFPVVVSRGVLIDGQYVIIMEKLGKSLLEMKGLGESKYIQIARELIGILETLHDQGYIHTDIRPGHIMYNDGIITLIDFSSCLLLQKQRKFQGSPWFASPFVMYGWSPDKRDDVIQVIYSICYMLDGLKNMLQECQGLSSSFKSLLFYKSTKSAQEFCKESTYILSPALEKAYSYNYGVRPEYQALINCIDENNTNDQDVYINTPKRSYTNGNSILFNLS